MGFPSWAWFSPRIHCMSRQKVNWTLEINNILCQPIHPAKLLCCFVQWLHEAPALAKCSSDHENLDSYLTSYLCNLQEVFLLLHSALCQGVCPTTAFGPMFLTIGCPEKYHRVICFLLFEMEIVATWGTECDIHAKYHELNSPNGLWES